jgi:hypothetical protein
MTELVDVVVKVPSDRVAELYAFVAQLHRAKQSAGAHPRGEASGDAQDLVRMFRELAQDFFRRTA